MSLPALNGPADQRTLGADIATTGSEGGHRTLTLPRNGGKIITIPLAPSTARSLDPRTIMRCDRARASLDRRGAH